MNAAIIVLGYKLADNGEPEEELKGRVNKGINIFRKDLAKKIILSGGMTNLKVRKTEAKVIADFAFSNGMSSENIILEEESLDTIGNAYFSKQIVKNYNWKKIYVVTSCYHMPRASFIFDMCYGSNYKINYDYCYEVEKSYDKIESERKKFKVVKFFFKGMEPGEDKELDWRIFNTHKLYKGKK